MNKLSLVTISCCLVLLGGQAWSTTAQSGEPSTVAAAAAEPAAPTAKDEAAPAQVATADAAASGKPYDGHVQCEGGECKVDTFLIKGFRTFSQCQVCHGIDASGSTIAPSLLDRFKTLDKETVYDRIANGFTGQIGVMPTWKDNPNVMKNIDNLYAYLKARSDGVIPAGNLPRF